MGGAGLFTLITPYRTPTSVPTANEMSSAFSSNSLEPRLRCHLTADDRCGGTGARVRFRIERSHVAVGLLLQNLSSVHTSVETEHLFPFRVPGSHSAVCVTDVSNGTISIGGGFNTPVSNPHWSSLSISAICREVKA